MLKKLYYKIFKTYKVFQTCLVDYEEADKMIKESANKPEEWQWVLSDKEDANKVFGMVWLCRRVRITG